MTEEKIKIDPHDRIRHIIAQKIISTRKSVPYWAQQAGIAQRTLYLYLKGESVMSNYNLEKVLRALKIPFEDA